ncbi:MAG: PhzF family phenazine biosynthesis protein [Actinomycetota bacterium]
MPARYRVVDVFAREPLAGNALAVFPDPGSIDPDRMQRIAREMNLSETTFVTGVRPDGYDVRIFTPTEEMPFAGHPTLGTAWVLRELGAVAGERVIQRSPAGETPVEFDGDRVRFERTGSVSDDIPDVSEIVDALGVPPDRLGFDASELGAASIRLLPAIADPAVPLLMFPIGSPAVLAALVAPQTLGIHSGVYCFAPLDRGKIKARFFGSGFGVVEDPATGMAAAALGLYLGARAGTLRVEIEQGAEIGRPSFIAVDASPGRSRVSGAVHLVAEATLLA